MNRRTFIGRIAAVLAALPGCRFLAARRRRCARCKVKLPEIESHSMCSMCRLSTVQADQVSWWRGIPRVPGTRRSLEQARYEAEQGDKWSPETQEAIDDWRRAREGSTDLEALRAELNSLADSWPRSHFFHGNFKEDRDGA